MAPAFLVVLVGFLAGQAALLVLLTVLRVVIVVLGRAMPARRPRVTAPDWYREQQEGVR